MTYAEKFEELIKTVFPKADVAEIMGKCCPSFFFESANDDCNRHCYCSDCWNEEIEGAEK
ncbi:MAG: hypothetical protein LUD81_07895 [Clostridiales bacterium]|nr:hypothetical protein [Clostridiales bacterium]